jgi:hypothetical protein
MLAARVRNGVERLAGAIGLGSSAYWLGAAVLGLPGKPSFLLTYSMLAYGCYFAAGAVYFAARRSGWTPFRITVLVACLAGGAIQVWSSNRGLFPGKPVLPPEVLWLSLTGAIACSAAWNGAIWRALGPLAAPIRTIGLATFPLYLMHDTLGEWLIPKLGPIAAALLAIAVAVSFVIVAEPWARRALKALLATRLAAGPASLGGPEGLAVAPGPEPASRSPRRAAPSA